MNRNENYYYSCSAPGFGLGTLLTIIFMILKLCKVITWSWLMVFLPVIISVGISILIIIFCVIIVTIYRK